MSMDHRTPFTNADEKRTLCDFLDYLRDAIVRKASGLDAAAVRRSTVPSGTSLLVLVKHLTFVEIAWVQWSFAGLDVTLPSGDLEPGDTTESVIDAYRAATRRNNELLDTFDDLDQRCERKATAWEPMSLRWVLVHMIEETGRHAGHADIIREQIDGSTGR
ncbi:MAG: hypothetical protein QOI55_924 [Actinomycetota bacterium]|jgi:uncharacterized damage-inducible protein DinB|nr:hypothetical protein [Actinomycetota bacterium]